MKEPSSFDAKFGKLVIDTRSNQVIYKVKSYGGIVAVVYSDMDDNISADMMISK